MWVLVLLAWMSGGRETSMTNVPGFSSKHDCEVAASAARSYLAERTGNYVSHVCITTGGKK